MTQTADALVRSLQSFVENIPFAKGLNLKVNSARAGFVEVRLEPSPHLFNHFGTYQAGVYFTLGEITGGLLCGTFLDLSKNLLITQNSAIEFGQAADGILTATAEAALLDIEKLLAHLKAKKKASTSIDVAIKSLNGKAVAHCRNEYYLRLGIPRSFSLAQNPASSKGI